MSLRDLLAAPCGRGTYFNSTTETCMYCPVGKYQSLEGHSSCDDCPADQTTETFGSTSMDECFRESLSRLLLLIIFLKLMFVE